MARIAEDLLLLLLDNPSAQPQLDRAQLGRVLAAALLLDVAHDCRVRPGLPAEPVPAGRLVALQGPVALDPAVRPTLALLERGPLTPAEAIESLRKRAEDDVLDQLLRTGQIHQIQLSSHRLRRNTYAWPLHDRARVDRVRSAVTAALFGGYRPDAVTAATIALLHRAGALGPVLGLDEAGARRTEARAAEIVPGSWADGTTTAAVNLAVTAQAVLPALG